MFYIYYNVIISQSNGHFTLFALSEVKKISARKSTGEIYNAL